MVSYHRIVGVKNKRNIAQHTVETFPWRMLILQNNAACFTKRFYHHFVFVTNGEIFQVLALKYNEKSVLLTYEIFTTSHDYDTKQYCNGSVLISIRFMQYIPNNNKRTKGAMNYNVTEFKVQVILR